MKLQYLTILLDDSAIAFCAYDSYKNKNLIKREYLQLGIEFAKNNNLQLQFVYPDYDLPKEYKAIIYANDHIKISSYEYADSNTDIAVITQDTGTNVNINEDAIYIIKTSSTQLSDLSHIVKNIYNHAKRINIIICDIENFDKKDFENYKQALTDIRKLISYSQIDGFNCQINVLTDLLLLGKMNNCNAGLESITLAPNGKLYICPAFYYYNQDYDCGQIGDFNIKNEQLLDINHAPICMLCDAFHCKRCLYKNLLQTLEINTPSYEQCYLSHIEREQSRILQQQLPQSEHLHYIQQVDYKEPFDKIKI